MKKFWIKERDNPQTGTYYVAEGPLSNTAARKKERTLYGCNRMLCFDTREEYEQCLKQLLADKQRVHL